MVPPMPSVTIRRLQLADVHAMLAIIRNVRIEYGLEQRVTQILEPSDYAMFETYARRRAVYFVAVAGGEIVGGAGIAPLAEGDGSTCELQRMYLRSDCRGRGIGRLLFQACLEAAQSRGFARCYAETISEMSTAIAFYMRHGFRRLTAPVGRSGHGHNDQWLMLSIPGTGNWAL